MPYINIKSTNQLSCENLSQFANELTENLSKILSKPTDSIMVEMQWIDKLFLGGNVLDTGAIVQVMVFGKTSLDIKSKVNDYLVSALNTTMDIDVSSIYIIYSDKAEWGYKGRLISK